jgi:hypothetical protein
MAKSIPSTSDRAIRRAHTMPRDVLTEVPRWHHREPQRYQREQVKGRAGSFLISREAATGAPSTSGSASGRWAICGNPALLGDLGVDEVGGFQQRDRIRAVRGRAQPGMTRRRHLLTGLFALALRSPTFGRAIFVTVTWTTDARGRTSHDPPVVGSSPPAPPEVGPRPFAGMPELRLRRCRHPCRSLISVVLPALGAAGIRPCAGLPCSGRVPAGGRCALPGP